MFYSHTFLARKGPLGTVWCAAHVQHRLKKSHYTATHIPSTVERIMFPEVPIALRMSGHLLLGIVRIYSKKIDYLYQDYNVLLIGLSKAFDASTDVNLPKDATYAKSDDVTLPSPSKFALDELDLDEYSPERFRDNHRKSLEDITLTDQIPVGRDLFIAVNISEDVPRDSPQLETAPGSGPMPMEEDSPPSTPNGATADSGPSNQIGVNQRLHEDSIPEFERIRAAVRSEFMVDPLIFHGREGDVLEPDTVLELMRTKDIDTPVVEEMSVSGGKSMSRQENQERSAASELDHSEFMGNDAMFSLISGGKSISRQENQEQCAPSELGPDNFPERELILDAGPSEFMVNSLILPGREDDVLEPDTVLEELMRAKNIDTQDVEEMLVPERNASHQQENQEPQSAPSEQGPDINGPAIAFEILPSPTIEQRRPRRGNRLFDANTVLTNNFMRRALDDSRDLKRRRKDWCSSLGSWRLSNKKKQEKVFLDPLTTGLCDDLSNMFDKDYISAKDHLVGQDEAHPEPNVAQPPSPVAQPRSPVAQPRSPAALPPSPSALSPSPASQSPSPAAQPHSPAAHSSSPAAHPSSPAAHSSSPAAEPPSNLGTETEHFLNFEGSAETNNIMIGVMNSSNSLASSLARASTGSRVSVMETPSTCSEERPGFNNNRLSDIQELDNCGELSFLDEEDHTPAGLRGTPESLGTQRGTPEVDSLSVRARAVAQYLKKKSSATPILGEDHGDLSLNTILEGKKRKICARMFFETLVLKNSGLVDVKQDETYGDIKLKVTPKLSKEQFSN